VLSKYSPFKFLVYFSFFCFLSIVCTEARVFKCIDSDGKVLYSNTPCPQDTQEQSFELKESYTINDEQVEDDNQISPEITDEFEGIIESLSSGGLEINVAQVRITLRPDEIGAIHQGVRFVYDYFKNVYEIVPNNKVDIKIFGRNGDFLSYQKYLIGNVYSSSGIFVSRTGEALINGGKYRDKVVGISIHEACHAMIQQAGYSIPVWVNEGIAEYFETISISQSQVLFNPQHERHNEIAALLKEKQLITLLEYFGLSNSVWKDRNLVEDRTSRSIAWSLVHYLMSSKDGTETIKKILNNFSVDDETPSMFVVNKSYSGGLNLLEKNWHEFLGGRPSTHVFNTNE